MWEAIEARRWCRDDMLSHDPLHRNRLPDSDAQRSNGARSQSVHTADPPSLKHAQAGGSWTVFAAHSDFGMMACRSRLAQRVKCLPPHQSGFVFRPAAGGVHRMPNDAISAQSHVRASLRTGTTIGRVS